jgi:hypothetical protein
MLTAAVPSRINDLPVASSSATLVIESDEPHQLQQADQHQHQAETPEADHMVQEPPVIGIDAVIAMTDDSGKIISYRCGFPGCHKVYKQKGKCITHQKTHNEPEEDRKCRSCKRVLSSVEKLNSHIPNCEGERECNYCGEWFADKHMLKTHFNDSLQCSLLHAFRREEMNQHQIMEMLQASNMEFSSDVEEDDELSD